MRFKFQYCSRTILNLTLRLKFKTSAYSFREIRSSNYFDRRPNYNRKVRTKLRMLTICLTRRIDDIKGYFIGSRNLSWLNDSIESYS